MEHPLVPEAIVRMARKRRLLDPAQCMRLMVLLRAHGIASVAAARAWLDSTELMPQPIAQQLLMHLPKPDEAAFDRYQPIVHLADGGMGSVWLAAAPDTGLVVVKTVRANLANNPEVAHRFDREFRYMMELNHPNVVACLDHGHAADGTLFMVLEFVVSGDLKDLIELHGGLSEAMALGVIYQAVDALAAAHARQLIHRDIKPANIFVSADGFTKLADFGLARSTADHRTALTMAGQVMGSPYYMSPEQVIADPNLDVRSDLYALGSVLYFCLAATNPYQGQFQDVLHAHCTAPIPEIRKVRPDISERVAKIINTCMQKDRKDRYADPTKLLAALAEALSGKSSTQMPTPTPASRMPPAKVPTMNSTPAKPVKPPTAVTSPPPPVQAPSASPRLLPAVSGETPEASIWFAAEPQPSAPAKPPTANKPATRAPGSGPAYDADKTPTVAPGTWSSSERIASAAAPTIVAVAPPPSPPPAPPAPKAPQVEGSIESGLESTWMALTADDVCLMLYVRRTLLLGKLCEPPIDICLRKYPTSTFREACLKISRQHLRLAYDVTSNRVQVIDLGGANGSKLSGKALSINSPTVIEPDIDHTLEIAGAINLKLRAVKMRGAPLRSIGVPSSNEAAFAAGLDCAYACDSVIITRPDNRPGMAYALVLRRLTIGGEGADLRLPGGEGNIELARYSGRWIWRPAPGDGPWKPLTVGASLPCAGRQLLVQAGHYELFARE